MDYKQSGVNIDAGNEAVQLIKDSVKTTYTPNVLNDLGGFAAMYELKNYKNPVLVSCTDGVGTKLKIAIDSGIYNTVGIDLVAMSVNDLICCGAKPLFFLDYIAVHALNPIHMKQIIEGIVTGCKESDCALIGGEMAEMNDLYKKGDFDLAGFAVGAVEKDQRIAGQDIKANQYVYGFKSSGIHSNGFSLVRKVLTPDVCKKVGLTAMDLLTPTKLYVRPVMDLIKTQAITGICHITGGGIQENLVRILPKNVTVTIEENKIQPLPIFDILKQEGNISEKEMYRVFNMGIGMIIISSEKLPESDDFYLIGHTSSGERAVTLV